MVVAFSLPPAHAGPLLQQLGPGHGHQQHRDAAAVVGHVLDQVEQARLGPVEVVEDHDQNAGRVCPTRMRRACRE
jgi:hypothetical protein